MGEIKKNWNRYKGGCMNIILIGMRGSGKTSVGKLLSERLMKPFYDLDSILAAKEGIPIAEVVAKRVGIISATENPKLLRGYQVPRMQ